MKAISSIFIIVSLLVIMLLISCSSFKQPEFISMEKIEVIKEDSNGLFLHTELIIFNPNRYKILAKNMSFKLYIDTIFLGKGIIEDGTILAANDTSVISSKLIMNKNAIQSMINLKDSVSLHVLGSSDIPYLSKTYYFEFTHKIYTDKFITSFSNNIIQDLSIKISEIKINKLDIPNMYLDIIFNLYNSSSIKCKINKLDINIYKRSDFQEIIGSSKIIDDFYINTDSVSEFKCKVKVNSLKMVSSVLSNTIQNKNSFYIRAISTIEYNSIKIPFTIEKRVDYNPLTLNAELK